MQLFAAVLATSALLASNTIANQSLYEREVFEPTDCLEGNSNGINALRWYKSMTQGAFVDDGIELLKNWQVGMNVKAINYCIDEEDLAFISMQVILGSNEEGVEDLELYKHGGEGGWCHQWVLQPNDFIERIEYTFDDATGRMQRLRFWTVQGHQHILGRGHGYRVIYMYNKYKQFTGIFSYEEEEVVYGFGSLENYCTDFIVANKQMLPSTSDSDMEAAAVADGGTIENELDIIQAGLDKDEEIAEPDSSAHVVVDKPNGELVKTETFETQPPKSDQDPKSDTDKVSSGSGIYGGSDDQEEVEKLLEKISRMDQQIEKLEMTSAETEQGDDEQFLRASRLLIPLLILTWIILCCLCCFVCHLSKDLREERQEAVVAAGAQLSSLNRNERSHSVARLMQPPVAEPSAIPAQIAKVNNADQVEFADEQPHAFAPAAIDPNQVANQEQSPSVNTSRGDEEEPGELNLTESEPARAPGAFPGNQRPPNV